jgi:Exodeoxyribonuclease X-like C-terminal
MSEPNVVPFGKYKGRDILEVIETDPGYLQWLSGQDWFRAKYITLHQTIINRVAEPEETPEHNALQVLFLDDAFCLKFCGALGGGESEIGNALERHRQHAEQTASKKLKEVHERLARYPGDNWTKDEYLKAVHIRELLAAPIAKINWSFSRDFEVRGIDVKLSVTATSANHSSKLLAGYSLGYWNALDIEIKPTVSDDYPAVLRQMKRNDSKVLFLKSYTGQGATREQFIKTFETTGFRVVFLDEVV